MGLGGLAPVRFEGKTNQRLKKQQLGSFSLGELGGQGFKLYPYTCFCFSSFVPYRVKARDPSLSGYMPRGRCWPERRSS